MKKRWIPFLCAAALLTFASCGTAEHGQSHAPATSQPTTQTTVPVFTQEQLVINSDDSEIVAQAKAAVNNQAYQEAYKLLTTAENDATAAAMLKNFAFVPTTSSTDDDVKTTFTYDAAGNLIQEQFFRNGELKRTIDYTHDSHGNVIKQVETETDGIPTEYSYTYEPVTYDDDGNTVKSTVACTKLSDRTDTAQTVKTFSAEGYLITEVTTYNGSEQLYTHTYDDQGHRIKTVLSFSDGTNNITDYTYDTSGNCVKQVNTDSFNKQDTTEYFYDAAGYLAKTIFTSPFDTQTVIDYTLDENGNPITAVRTNSDDSRVVSHVQWELIYYHGGVPEPIISLYDSIWHF